MNDEDESRPPSNAAFIAGLFGFVIMVCGALVMWSLQINEQPLQDRVVHNTGNIHTNTDGIRALQDAFVLQQDRIAVLCEDSRKNVVALSEELRALHDEEERLAREAGTLPSTSRHAQRVAAILDRYRASLRESPICTFQKPLPPP